MQFYSDFLNLCPPLPLRNSTSLRCSLRTQSCYWSQMSSNWFPQFSDVYELFVTEERMLLSGKLDPVPNLLRHAAAIKFKVSWYVSWNSKMSHFQHFICLQCSITDKILFANHCILLLFVFHTESQLFWNWVSMIIATTATKTSSISLNIPHSLSQIHILYICSSVQLCQLSSLWPRHFRHLLLLLVISLNQKLVTRYSWLYFFFYMQLICAEIVRDDFKC